MARTVRQAPKTHDPRHYFPSSKARKTERRSDRHATRLALKEYAR